MVKTHCILGYLVDSELTFTPMLQFVAPRFYASFLQLYHAAESGGFSVPILAQQVQSRIVPGILYLAPLLVMAPRMAGTLDRLQSKWARMILGCHNGPLVAWPLLRAACGWNLRLSCQVWEVAFVAFARLVALPELHPGHRLLQLALATTAPSWA